MATYSLRLNGGAVSAESWDPAQALLYVLRGALGLHGPKFGCGLGQGGACTVLMDAVFDATGVRLRTVPFTAERVKAALAMRTTSA
jgi:aerobic-type carbon monoxide dehydrogenase small subunit (CoxS/CutS family)